MLKNRVKNVVAVTTAVAAAFIAAAPADAKSGSSELITHEPAQIVQVKANSSRTAYEQSALMQISANVKLDLDAGIAAHIKNWKTWLTLKMEDQVAVQFKEDGVSKSYPVFNRPQKFEGLVAVGVNHLRLSPVAVGFCNGLADTLRAQGHSNGEIFSIDRTIPLSLSTMQEFKTIGAAIEEFDQALPGDFQPNMTLVCKGRPHTPVQTAGDVKFEHGDFKTKGIELFLSTFAGATTQPNPATVCKKGRVLVRVKTSKAGAAKFKLWTKVGGNTSSKVVDAWASHDGNGGFKAEHTEWVSVDKTTQIQAMAEDMVNSIGQSTQWKDLTLQCSNKENGGGFTQDTLPPDNVLPDAEYSGEITVADSALTPKNQCPRQGQAVFKINSNKSSAVDYKVDCTGGRSWQGTVQMFANGPGKYQGVAAKNFDVDKTENVACVLKRVKDNQNFVLALSGKQFTCANPAIPPATSDLAPDTGRPDDDIPQGQTLTGDFGFVDHGAPKCPRTGKALVTFKSPKSDNIHWSLDCKFSSKSGVLTPQPNPAGGYMAATLVPIDVNTTMDETCILRTVAPYNPKDHVSRSHLFQCVTPSGHSASNDVQVEPRDEPVLPAQPNAVSSGAEKLRLEALRVRQQKADAEKLRRAQAAAQVVEEKRKRDAAIQARQLKLQADAAKRAAQAAAQARANAARQVLIRKQTPTLVAPTVRKNTAPLVNRRIMNFR